MRNIQEGARYDSAIPSWLRELHLLHLSWRILLAFGSRPPKAASSPARRICFDFLDGFERQASLMEVVGRSLSCSCSAYAFFAGGMADAMFGVLPS